MNNFFSLFKRRKSKLYIAIDVGSYSIKTFIFEIAEKNNRILIIKKRIFFLPFSISELEVLKGTEVIASRLREIIFNFLKELKRIPDKIIIGLDSVFASSHIENFKFTRDDPQKIITQKELKNLFEAAVEDKKKQIAGGGKTVIWANNFSILVDGYKIHDFGANVYGKDVDLKIFLLTSDIASSKELMAIPKILGGIPVEFTSLLFNLGKAIAKNFPNGKDCSILDIGSAYTNIITLRNGELDEVSGFAYGGGAFSRRLAQELDMNIKEADELKKQYAKGIVTDTESKKISGVFTVVAGIWEENFIKILGNLSQANFFPSTLYIIGGGSGIPEIKSVLESRRWVSNIISPGSIEFQYIKPDDILRGITSGADLKDTSEVGLASLVFNCLN